MRGHEGNVAMRFLCKQIAVLCSVFALLSVAIAPMASAEGDGRNNSCELHGHCYAVVTFLPYGGSYGARTTAIHSNCMAPINTTWPINETLWAYDGPTGYTDSYWVEAGLAKGATLGSSHALYWAVMSYSGNYNEHFGPSWSYSTNYDIHIETSPIYQPGYWNIEITGPGGLDWLNTTAGQQGYTAAALSSGLESGYSTNKTGDTTGTLKYFDSSDALDFGWADSYGHAQESTTGNATGYWETTYTSYHSQQNGPC